MTKLSTELSKESPVLRSVWISPFVTAALITLGCAFVQMEPEQIEQIRSTAAAVLPSETQVEVSTESALFAKPDLVISAHLLEGHEADETSPYIKGDYGTHDKLTNLVRYRCARIIKSVLAEAEIPDVGKLTIKARHGVRKSYYDMPNISPTNVAMTIYVASLPIDTAHSRNWSQVDIAEVLNCIQTEKNIIPSLTFSTQ